MSNHKRLALGEWNIGIVDQSIDSIFESGELRTINWVKHRYVDRYFADPFLWSRIRIAISSWLRNCSTGNPWAEFAS